MATVGSIIAANGKSFTVRASYEQRAIRRPAAFRKYKNINIIRHKDLDFIYTDRNTGQKYADVLQEIWPVMSRLMGANSILKGEIVPLGELQKENGKFYVEDEFRGETTRFYLFTEAQAKQIGIDLKQPAFAVIEDRYNIADKGKNDYAIHVPKYSFGNLYKNKSGNLQTGNLRLFYGRYEYGQLRYIEQEFNAPLGEIAGSFDAKKTRFFCYCKPGPAVRGGDSDPSVDSGNFNVGFGGAYFAVKPNRFGVLTEKTAEQPI